MYLEMYMYLRTCSKTIGVYHFIQLRAFALLFLFFSASLRGDKNQLFRWITFTHTIRFLLLVSNPISGVQAIFT